MIEIRDYVTVSGKNVFEEWLDSLKDEKAAARVTARISRLAQGNLGNCKPVGEGVWELRIDWGPGYRVYYSFLKRTCVLLLCAGDKRRQQADIARAVEYLKDYKRRSTKP
jgi:putative addiction module killer protein